MMNIILVEAGGVTLYSVFGLTLLVQYIAVFVVPSPTDSPREERELSEKLVN